MVMFICILKIPVPKATRHIRFCTNESSEECHTESMLGCGTDGWTSSNW